MNDSEIELICPECGDVFTAPPHTTTAKNGDYRPCSWTCRHAVKTTETDRPAGGVGYERPVSVRVRRVRPRVDQPGRLLRDLPPPRLRLRGELPMSEADTEQGVTCPKCRGVGVISVVFGKYGGTVDCDLCDGTGGVSTETDRPAGGDGR